MENQQQEQPITPKIVDDPSQLSMFADNAQPPTPQAPAQQQQQAPTLDEAQVVGFLSERLGKPIKAINELSAYIDREPVEIDERVKAINEFVKNTKKAPEDWFKYQSYDPAKMDDVSVLKAALAIEHPDLGVKEIDILAKSKYGFQDESILAEDELEVYKLNLRINAEDARKKIQKVRDQFAAPTKRDDSSPFNSEWVSAMEANAKEIEALEFALPSGEKFSFGIDETYRPKLIESNKQIEKFFDQYVENGQWNFEKLNAHRVVMDNIENIVSAAYNQGISAGQRGVVVQQANVSQANPRQVPHTPAASAMVNEQIKNILQTDMVTFNV